MGITLNIENFRT